MINVFDIATLISYLFSDFNYGDLNSSPGQVITVQGRDNLPLQCENELNRGDYYTQYALDTCTFFDIKEERRLSQRLSASTLSDQWRAQGSISILHPNDRNWYPIQLQRSRQNVPYQLGSVEHSILPDIESLFGRWYTLKIATIPLRIHTVFTGLQSQSRTKLSYKAYDGTAPEDPFLREVRFTRFCELGTCDDTCAVIETPHSSRTAMIHDTLELIQRPIERACPFEIHVWVPNSVSQGDCVGIDYMTVADGLRGQFARNTKCTRTSSSPSQPPYPLPPPYPPSNPPYIDKVSTFPLWTLSIGFGCVIICVCSGIICAVYRKKRKIQPGDQHRTNNYIPDRIVVQPTRSQIPQIRSQIPQVRSQIPQVRSQIPQVRSQTPQVRSQTSQVRSQTPQVRSQTSQVRSQIPQVRSQIPQVRSQTSQVRSQIPQVRSQTSQVRSQIPQVRSQIPQVRSQTSQVRSQIPQVRSQTSQVRSQIPQVRSPTNTDSYV